MTQNFHEDFGREEEVNGSSDRGFGQVFAVVFAIVAFWPLTGAGGSVHLWSLGLAIAFLAIAYLRPSLLAPLNWVWTRFGLLLHRIVNPLVMGMLFYLTVTPMGLIMRALGKDLLRLKRDPEAKTYWIEREPPGPAPDSMSNQF
ncbi:MAG: SxtJ family membrane protein [Proteobacteria bacterium]|nr:SxtJ family membrane protein [Pseudomonadota bacterium]